MTKTIRLVALLFTLVSLLMVTNARSEDARKTPPAAEKKAAREESPFGCNRLALSSAERRRHFEELGPALRALRKEVRELPDGYELEFPSDRKTVAMIAEWVAQERLCCPFFDIDVRFAREGGPVWLRLTGRPGTKDFIRVDGADWIRK
jgi:hypothetical protein